MSSKLEDVARALAKEDGKDPDAPAWIKYPSGNTFGICWRDQYLNKARAALTAMRGPTDNMLDAATERYLRGEGGTDGTVKQMAEDFNFMIEAALEER